MQIVNDNTINIVSIADNGLLVHSTCLHPFYSPDDTMVAFWLEDYDYQTDSYLSTYQLYIKNLVTNTLTIVNSGNGKCPLPPNMSSNQLMYNASFSPDSTKILFLCTSTNLIASDSYLLSTQPDKSRWFVYDIVNDTYTRVSSSNIVFGNSHDANEAVWKDNDNIVFVSHSLNFFSGTYQTPHTEVYMKTLSNGNISHISRKETGNPSPFFIANCENIAVSANKVTFYSYELGHIIKNLLDDSITRLQNLPAISSYGIVSTDALSWNNSGDKLLIRISYGTSITADTNGLTDDFVYNFNDDTIIPINDNTGGTIYGNGYSQHSSFSPDGINVAFISNSYNIDPSSTNQIDNLYIKNLQSGVLTRVSIPILGGNITNNVLGYTWITNTKIAFTTASNNIVIGDTDTDTDWFIRDLITEQTIRINYNNGNIIFSEKNDYSGILRKSTFNNNGTRMLFITKLMNINNTFYTPYYDEYDVFEKVIEEEIKAFPTHVTPTVEPNDAINAYTIHNKLYAYTANDTINGIPTYSILGSVSVERVNSIQYRNINSSVRWMGFKYPNLPYDCPMPANIGVGIFQDSSTLLDDIIDIKQNSTTTAINDVYGLIAVVNVRPQNDLVLQNAGDDQYIVCTSTIYLQSSIVGNMAGHTFLWEQISGGAVSIIPVSQTQAYYISPGGGGTDDRVFRFWIDKGKFNEQYQDVTIYGTPVDFYTNNASTLSSINDKVTDPVLLIKEFTIMSRLPFDINIPFNGLVTYDDVMVGLSWTLPNIFYEPVSDKILYYIDNFIGTNIEANIDGNWIELYRAYGVANNRYYSPIVIGWPIRIGAIYDLNGNESIFYSGIIYNTPQMNAYTVLSNEEVTSSLNTNIISTIYRMEQISLEDNITLENTSITSDFIPTRNNIIYSLEPIDLDDTITVANTNVTHSYTFTIYRYNGAIIGG